MRGSSRLARRWGWVLPLAALFGGAAGAKQLRPAALVLGVESAPELAGEAPDLEKLNAPLLSAARRAFARVIGPDKAKEELGADYALAARCQAPACLAPLAERFDVDRVVSAVLASGESGPVLRLSTFSRWVGTLERQEVDVTEKRAFTSGLAAHFKKVSTGLAQLKVKTNVPKAKVTLGEWSLGTGSMTRLVPAGSYLLKVGGGIYVTEETQLALAPGASREVEAFLVVKPSDDDELLGSSKPVEVASATPPPEPPAEEPAKEAVQPPSEAAPVESAPVEPPPEQVERPLPWQLTHGGTYVSAAGALLVGAGIFFGQQAMGAQRAALDQEVDGVYGISRTRMLAARREAVAANVLVSAGVATLAGGVVWLVMLPGKDSSAVAAGVSGEF